MEYTKLGNTGMDVLESASVAWGSGMRNVGFISGC